MSSCSSLEVLMISTEEITEKRLATDNIAPVMLNSLPHPITTTNINPTPRVQKMIKCLIKETEVVFDLMNTVWNTRVCKMHTCMATLIVSLVTPVPILTQPLGTEAEIYTLILRWSTSCSSSVNFFPRTKIFFG